MLLLGLLVKLQEGGPVLYRRNAERFDVSRFKSEMRTFINLKMLEFKNRQLADG